MGNLKRFLQDHTFFQGMGDVYLDLLAGCAQSTQFKANEIIFKEGEESNLFYIIQDGLISIQLHMQSDSTVTIQNIGENDIIGWSWLYPPHYWRFHAIAKRDTRAVVLDGECLRNKCNKNHDLGYELTKRFGNVIEKQLEATRRQLLDIIVNTQNQKSMVYDAPLNR
jgi:CRP/FNR family transcriptional regulator, cyclic AMP receptor protein